MTTNAEASEPQTLTAILLKGIDYELTCCLPYDGVLAGWNQLRYLNGDGGDALAWVMPILRGDWEDGSIDLDVRPATILVSQISGVVDLTVGERFDEILSAITAAQRRWPSLFEVPTPPVPPEGWGGGSTPVGSGPPGEVENHLYGSGDSGARA